LVLSCWAVFGVVWLRGALLRGARSSERAHGERDVASTVAALAGLVAVLSPASLWEPLSTASPAIRLAGASLLVLSTAAAVWSRAVLGSMWSSGALVRPGHALRTKGPYRLSRHPIYTAVIGMVAGTALSEGIGRWAAIFVVVSLTLLFKARAEERLLRHEFGTMYERYTREVPRLVPSIRRGVRQTWRELTANR
jgi:protein-S-isoprenylcysteine O-methyltransferase Ste14